MVAPHSPLSLDEAKRAARLHALAVRANHDALACGIALAEHVLRHCLPPRGAVVAGFLPIGDEIDVRPLLQALHDRGHPLVLPVTPARGLPLCFRLWTPDAELIEERFGTQRPIGPERVPDVLLVPMLAFDHHGHRLGYGAGYYDRTLAGLPERFALGCAYAAQRVDAVPVGPYDIALDAVATETGVVHCRRRSATPGSISSWG
ncbi:MAG: 5-formyltetrahydrofolate cyclo-ligase [Acetobacteraceae bacterium]|nr:5-formyltetrahydrofolate cyclo-ligase [Acetobacteraceae bacterium]